MPSLVIFCQNQFGYHIDTYQYCKYLRDYFDITYFCWDYGMPKQKLNSIKIIYVSRKGNIFLRNFRYIISALKYIRDNNPDICFIKYFRGCSFLKLFFYNKKFIFDIRSGYIKKNNFYRFLYDNFLRLESLFFENITIISESLAKRLRLNKYYILPLGSEVISDKNKNFDTIHLLYVGTFENRNIEKTILGFLKFYKEYSNRLSIKYTIIGSGTKELEIKIKEIIDKNKLSDVVKLMGYVPFEKLKPFFDQHNIGVSFVPITPYFNCQPPTKTFDYLLSGMAVIATKTYENSKIITKDNGVLIDDSCDGFYEGLKKIYKRRMLYNSNMIRTNAMKYTWEKICQDFQKYLFKVLYSSR